MTDPRAASITSDLVVADLLERLGERLRENPNADIEAFLREYPEHAERLRSLIPAAELMAELGRSGATSLGSAPFPGLVQPEPAVEGCVGDFQIIREVGRGGMGVVYEARQLSLRRRVALKVLPFAAVLDSRQLQRFKNEALAAAQLKHPHIVSVYGVGCERGVHHYAMEYIEGRTLAEVIDALRAVRDDHRGDQERGQVTTDFAYAPATRAAKPPTLETERERTATGDTGLSFGGRGRGATELPQTGLLATLSTAREEDISAYFRRIAELGRQVAEALDHAHQHSILHRDVKPSNLMLDAEGKVLVTDFGLARIETDVSLTMTGDMMGTLRYMSPESITGGRGPAAIDRRTDVYSLGATLYELFTLSPAYPGTDRAKLLAQIANDEPIRPRQLTPQIPEDLETIVVKAMEKAPEDRYQTAQDLADDLRRFLEHHPISAKRPTPLQRVAKWSRRHSGVVWSVTAIFFVATLALSISTVLVLRAYHREAEARQNESVALQNERDAVQRESAAAALAREGQRLAIEQRDAARYSQYVADMRLAHSDWKSGQTAGMLGLLESHIPHPGETDVRGWEWKYLLSLTRRDAGTFRPDVGENWWVAWSPDGDQLAIGGDDIQIRDVKTRQVIATIAGAGPGSQVPAEGAGPIAWSPNGKMLAAAAAGSAVKIWELPEARERLNLGQQSFPPQRISWSPDGGRLATGDADGNVRVFSLAFTDSPEAIVAPVLLRGKVEWVRSLAWSPDGAILAVGDNHRGRLDLWDVREHKLIQSIEAHTHYIKGLAWSPDGTRLATGSNDQRIRIRDTKTWQIIHDFQAHLGCVNSLAWSPDGKWLASGGTDSTVRIWDARSGERTNMLRGHCAQVHSVSWSSDSRHVASAGGDRTVKIWDPYGGQDALEFPAGGPPVAWSPDGRRLVRTGPERGVAEVIEWRTGNVKLRLRVEEARFFYGFDWSSDGTRLVGTDHGGKVVVWETASGGELWRVEQPHRRPGGDAEVRSVSFSPDGRHLATGGQDTTIKIWDPASGNLLKTLSGHRATVGSVVWSPDGSKLASKDWSQNVRVWNTANWTESLRLNGNSSPPTGADGRYSLAWSPDSRQLAAGTSDGSILVWNMETGRERMSLRAHLTNVRTISWSPDGRRLASGSEDRSVKIWDIETGRELLSFDGQEGWVQCVAWSPDGLRLVSAVRPIRIWGASIEPDDKP